MKTFKDIADEVLDRGEGSKATSRQHAWLLELLKPLHQTPIEELTAAQVFKALKTIGETRSSAHAAKLLVGRVVRLAIALGDRTGHDFTRDLRGVLKRQKAPKPRAAITDPGELGRLLAATETLSGSTAIRDALRVAPHVFVRPSELRGMRWEEIDFAKALWTIPAERTKLRRDHVVPLSTQVTAILWARQPAAPAAGKVCWVSPFVFPGRDRRKPISQNTLLLGLRAMMYSPDEMTPHGYRATASTLLREVLGLEDELIEMQLAHLVGSQTRRAYDRAARIPERAAMMQTWSDYLDGLKASAAAG